MRFNKITINEANIRSVYGRLKKFFKEDRLYEEWHSEKRFKKRIKDKIEWSKYDSETKTFVPDGYRHIKNLCNTFSICMKEWHKKPIIVINYYSGVTETPDGYCGFSLECGDVISFIGNRINLKEKHEKFVFTYQILPPDGLTRLTANIFKKIAERAGDEDIQDDEDTLNLNDQLNLKEELKASDIELESIYFPIKDNKGDSQ